MLVDKLQLELVSHVYNLWVEKQKETYWEQTFSDDHFKLFVSLYKESEGRLPGSALHNPWVNQQWFRDLSPIYTPSRFYMLKNIFEPLVLEHHPDQPASDCAVFISTWSTDQEVNENIFQALSTISQQQPISHLDIEGLTCDNIADINLPVLSASVVYLKLWRCNLPSNILGDFLKQLHTCESMKSLRFHEMDLKDQGCQLAESMNIWGPNSPLELFDLWNCNISQEALADIMSALAHFKQLKNLHLIETEIGEAGKQLVESIQSLGPNLPLEVFDVWGGNFPEAVAVALNSTLSSCKSLTKLCLDTVNTIEAGEELAKSIKSWGLRPPLTLLDLHRGCIPKEISAEVMTSILTVLKNCKQITQLDLSGICIGAAGQHLVRSMRSWGNKPPLEELNLNQCAIPSKTCDQLLYALKSCKALTELNLGGNHLVGCLHRLFPLGHAGYSDLEYFSLDSTSLNREDLLTLKQAFETKKLQRVKDINLEKNGLNKMETELGEFLEVLLSHTQRKMQIHLEGNDLSAEFSETWTPKCDFADVTLHLGNNDTRSSTEVFRSKLQHLMGLMQTQDTQEEEDEDQHNKQDVVGLTFKK